MNNVLDIIVDAKNAKEKWRIVESQMFGASQDIYLARESWFRFTFLFIMNTVLVEHFYGNIARHFYFIKG